MNHKIVAVVELLAMFFLKKFSNKNLHIYYIDYKILLIYIVTSQKIYISLSFIIDLCKKAQIY
jgi:hypothetical protein